MSIDVLAQTRARTLRSSTNLSTRMKRDPSMTVAPEKTIMPLYDPRSCVSMAPAIGPPTRDGIEITVYNIPILVPISLPSLICTTQGVIKLTKAPEVNPYTAANPSRTAIDFEQSHNVTHESPERNAAGKRRL